MKNINSKLLNAILPLFFFEWWYILVAFVFVILVESFIFSKFFRINLKLIWYEILIMNIFSTLGGFLIQGVIRLTLGLLLFSYLENYSDFTLLNIIFGNVEYPVNSEVTQEVIFDLVISLIITLTISIFMEYSSIRKNKIFENFKKKEIIKGVIIANLSSYVLLSFWIFYKLIIFKVY